jgi:hypothetical protein
MIVICKISVLQLEYIRKINNFIKNVVISRVETDETNNCVSSLPP